jgi:Flp pilus assembly protein TadG
MVSRLLSALRRLPRNERGTSVIEFGLLAPILAVTLMGVTDVSMAYSRKIGLEQAAFRALEKVAVGSVQSDYQYLKAEAAAAANVPASSVTVTNWVECDQVVQPLWTDNCTATQLTARYVRVSITTNYTPMFFEGPLAATGDGNGNVAVTAAASVRVQ